MMCVPVWSCYVRRWWDGFHSTQVPIVRCAWVPVVMSYLARHLIPLFPEDLTLALLARYWLPPGVTFEGPGMYQAGLRRGSIVGR
jgi:hypothetical protein